MEVDSSLAATALLTEHLQYTPLSLIDDIIDSVNNYIYQGVNSLETGLLSIPPERLGFKAVDAGDEDEPGQAGYPEAKKEVEEGLHKLETLLNSTVDKNFDKFEIFVLRNILAVPPDLTEHIRLSHYEGVTYLPSQNVPTVEELTLLRRKLAATRSVSRQLRHEHSRNEVVLTQLRSLLDGKSGVKTEPNLAFLQPQTSSPLSGQQPLTTNMIFTLSQLPGLKTTLTDLRTKLQALRDAHASLPTAKDDLSEERSGYIEQKTKAHLERNCHLSGSSSIAGQLTDHAELEAM
ncbi:hypothetical protein LTR66_017619, partial [Elasticomyces elasticus]